MKGYSVLIVDDDYMARLALREYINILGLNLNIVAEAVDGEQALSLMKKLEVNIVLTDIQMPHMDGLQLIKKLQENSLFSKCAIMIVLSAFGDHDKVREAFVLGAFDYMVKSKLDENYIKPILLRAIEEIEQREKNKEIDINHYIQTASTLHKLSVQADQSTEKVSLIDSEQMRVIQNEYGEKNVQVACIHFAQPIPFHQDQMFVLELLEFMKNNFTQVKCYMSRNNKREYILFLSFPYLNSLMDIRTISYSFLNELIMYYKQEKCLKVSIGVSEVVNGIIHLPSLVKQAQQLSLLSFFQEYYRVFYPEMLEAVVTSPYQWDQEWKLLKEKWINNMEYPVHSINNELDVLLGWFPNNREKVIELMIELIWNIANETQLIEKKNYIFLVIEMIRFSDNWIMAKRVVINYIEQCYVELSQKQEKILYWISPVIAKTKEILDRHYTEELNLAQISNMMGVSESYLSKQFVKEIGVNFITYLTQLRIERAKLDIKNGMKITEVAQKVGYVNPEHFSRLFKKLTGMSPIVYRKVKESDTIGLCIKTNNISIIDK